MISRQKKMSSGKLPLNEKNLMSSKPTPRGRKAENQG